MCAQGLRTTHKMARLLFPCRSQSMIATTTSSGVGRVPGHASHTQACLLYRRTAFGAQQVNKQDASRTSNSSSYAENPFASNGCGNFSHTAGPSADPPTMHARRDEPSLRFCHRAGPRFRPRSRALTLDGVCRTGANRL